MMNINNTGLKPVVASNYLTSLKPMHVRCYYLEIDRNKYVKLDYSHLYLDFCSFKDHIDTMKY